MMKVEFIYHRECPHVEGARANLLHALSEARVPMRWTEWDRPSPETPQYAREYGSPTILVNGRDIEGWTPSGEVTTCRIYGHQGVPSVELIRSALLRKTAEQKSSWYQNIATLTGISVALLPKVACPSCEVEVLDMRKSDVAARAKQYGVKTVPAVVVDGKLADCCKREGPDEGSLRSAGLGVP